MAWSGKLSSTMARMRLAVSFGSLPYERKQMISAALPSALITLPTTWSRESTFSRSAARSAGVSGSFAGIR